MRARLSAYDKHHVIHSICRSEASKHIFAAYSLSESFKVLGGHVFQARHACCSRFLKVIKHIDYVTIFCDFRPSLFYVKTHMYSSIAGFR
jgi:hypothetical protein